MPQNMGHSLVKSVDLMANLHAPGQFGFLPAIHNRNYPPIITSYLKLFLI